MIRRRRVSGSILALVALALGWLPTASWADEAELVTRGIETYARAMDSSARDERLALFAESERLFAAAIESGARNADIEVNRGNAALQAERLGAAVLAYRRALALDPSHPRARQNLDHARKLLPEWVPVPAPNSLTDTFFFWRRQVPTDRLDVVAAACFLLGAALLALALLRTGAGYRIAAVGLFTLWAAVIASETLDPGSNEEDAAVVVVPEAAARAADSLNAPRRFSEPLPGGTELRILEDRGGWLMIELHNGRSAWVLESAVARVQTDRDSTSTGL